MAFVANHNPVAAREVRSEPGIFAKLALRYSQYRKYCETYNELSALSTRELADLGLNHSMIRRIAIEAAYEH